MKRAFKILGAVIVLLAGVVGAGALYIHLDWPRTMTVRKIELSVDVTPERVERGKKLVSLRCAGCHLDQKTGSLTGIRLADQPPEFGTFYARNITRHETKGAGRYSDGELAFLLRTGIARDGRFTGPFMMAPNLADEDVHAIIAFLRSDDPWVAAKDVDDRESEATLLFKMLARFAFPPPPYPAASVPGPDPADPVATGKYLVTAVADCFVCHSESFPTLDALDPEKSGGYMSGGNTLLDIQGKPVRGANLTMDPETGIGSWSEADFVKTVRSGIRPNKAPMRYPMLPYVELTDDEVRAIWAYLQTVPPKKNRVEQAAEEPAPDLASSTEGAKLFVKYGCPLCHDYDGAGGAGGCDLRAARERYPTDAQLTEFLHDPQRFVPGSKMPSWEGAIAENEYPQIVEFVRTLETK